jgi:hypothetical protein
MTVLCKKRCRYMRAHRRIELPLLKGWPLCLSAVRPGPSRSILRRSRIRSTRGSSSTAKLKVELAHHTQDLATFEFKTGHYAAKPSKLQRANLSRRPQIDFARRVIVPIAALAYDAK